MKRVLIGLVVAVIGATSFGAHAGAQTRPFISDYSIVYRLGRDDERRSTLSVTERITVEFPQHTNKGIERRIPRKYQNHTLSLEFESVTRNGSAEPIYAEYTSGDEYVIQTGTDDYISGTQVFELKYSMRDVTQHVARINADEFYWDTNGTEWESRIEKLSVELILDENLRPALNGNVACYQGVFGSTQRCAVTKTSTGFLVSAENLGYNENVSLAVGFESGTFMPYVKTLWEWIFTIWVVINLLLLILSIILLALFLYLANRWKYRNVELGTIVPEYIPPRNVSVAAAAAVSPNLQSTIAAELTDLAVKRYIQILQTRSKSIVPLFRATEYDIKIVKDLAGLLDEERELLTDLFGHTPKVGERLPLKKLEGDSSVFSRFQDNEKKLKELMRHTYGYKGIDQEKRDWFKKAAKYLLILSILTLSPFMILPCLLAYYYSRTLWVLSDEGLRLRRQVKGLETYIKVAEKERIAMLQSPEGAEKVDINDPTNPAQLIKLYEKLLPYAILFRQERTWAKHLGRYYQQAGVSPEWYSGDQAFNALAFSSAITSFTSSVHRTGAVSSSTGGSVGGGFSGGGGGGGGGGFR